MSDHAPVALFVHRRPDHTRRTLEALARNEQAHASKLYVFADAARHEGERRQVAETREVVRGATGFAAVEVIERESNFGLADNIVEGVDEVVGQHGRVIVMEDDLVTVPHFLRFMNDALTHYLDTPRVMHVSGYMFPIDPSGLPETLFYRVTSCWGWATWSRAWRKPDRDARAVMARFTPEMRLQFDVECPDAGQWAQLEDNRRGVASTWAVFWYASVFLRQGLCLHPARSLVQNIGHDSSGTHSTATSRFDGPLSQEPIRFFDDRVEENPLVLQRMRAYYRAHRVPRWRRLGRRIKQRVLG
jgi:hypothetical protein